MTRWTRMGMAVGAAIVMGGLAVGALAWAQEAGRYRAGSGTEFRRGVFGEGAGFGRETRLSARLLAMLNSDRVKTALGLTADQTSQLREIVVNTQKSNIKTRADLAVRGIELRELLRADNPNRDAVMKKIDEISALRTEMMKEDAGALLSAKKVLTPEQQEKIRTFLERRRARAATPGRNFRWREEGPGRRMRPITPPNAPSGPNPPDAPQQQP
jgi:Spy/CpxP family protein refolding chaperone